MSLARMIVKSSILNKKERFTNELNTQTTLERKEFLECELIKLETILDNFKVSKIEE